MLRPILDLDSSVEDFYINSTPGGLYHHIESEVAAYEGTIAKLVILAGSNDLPRGVERAVASCKALFETIHSQQPHAQVSIWFSEISFPRALFNLQNGTRFFILSFS